jgi:hypothetical protein
LARTPNAARCVADMEGTHLVPARGGGVIGAGPVHPMDEGRHRYRPSGCPLSVVLVRSRQQEPRCASALVRCIGCRGLTRLGNPVVGPMSTPMVSKLSRVVVNGATRGRLHPSDTAQSRGSLWVSASTT